MSNNASPHKHRYRFELDPPKTQTPREQHVVQPRQRSGGEREIFTSQSSPNVAENGHAHPSSSSQRSQNSKTPMTGNESAFMPQVKSLSHQQQGQVLPSYQRDQSQFQNQTQLPNHHQQISSNVTYHQQRNTDTYHVQQQIPSNSTYYPPQQNTFHPQNITSSVTQHPHQQNIPSSVTQHPHQQSIPSSVTPHQQEHPSNVTYFQQSNPSNVTYRPQQQINPPNVNLRPYPQSIPGAVQSQTGLAQPSQTPMMQSQMLPIFPTSFTVPSKPYHHLKPQAHGEQALPTRASQNFQNGPAVTSSKKDQSKRQNSSKFTNQHMNYHPSSNPPSNQSSNQIQNQSSNNQNLNQNLNKLQLQEQLQKQLQNQSSNQKQHQLSSHNQNQPPSRLPSHDPNQLQSETQTQPQNQHSGQPSGQPANQDNSQAQVTANEEQFIDDYLQDTMDKLSDSAENHPDFVIANLLLTYNFFLSRAHQLVLSSNDLTGTKTYFKMIKLAIKSLLVIVKQYNQCLNPKLESVVYYKLAKLYLYETQNLNRADDYINKAIAISTRNSLLNIKFVSEFLAGEILNRSNPKLLINYLNDRINFYHQVGLASLSHLFTLMKINNLLVTDCKTALIVLQSLVKNEAINELTKIICLLYEANLHLYRGSPNFAKSCLDQIAVKDYVSYPPQIIAMKSLLLFQYYIQTNQTDQSKQISKELSNFISSQRQAHWSEWNENGFFKISLGSNDTGNTDVPFQILWLNSDEFVIMVYFLTGLHFLNDMSVHSDRATKIFGVCLGIVHGQLKELTNTVPSKRNFPIHQLTNKIIRLNYTRFLINYYQVWLRFTNNDFSGMGELGEFIKNYNENNFTEEELCYYKLFIPKVFHLYAIFCQSKGDIKAAKYYFLKVKSLTASMTQGQQLADITFMQLSLGIGGETVQPKDEFNELNLFSTFHLLVISNFELSNLAQRDSKNNDEISKCHKFITELYSDLTNAFKLDGKLTSNSFTMNFTHSNSLLLLTNQVILTIYLNNGFIASSNNARHTVNDSLSSSLVKLISGNGIPHGMTHIRVLVLYVLYLGSINADERKNYFNECVNLMSRNTDSDQILSLLILREIKSKNVEAGLIDNAKLNELEIQVLNNNLKAKFELANSS